MISAEKAGKPVLLSRYIGRIFPLVKEELKGWRCRAGLAPDPQLRRQALASIRDKGFHALGGSFFALYPGAGKQEPLVEFITAFQTISDYLDNLCDRGNVSDEKAFRRLHQAVTDALSPSRPIKDYYHYYPRRRDGGYLNTLVKRCRDFLGDLPAYRQVEEDVLALGSLYCDLQVYKHLAADQRVPLLQGWHRETGLAPRLRWWEFAAACGSTLGIFALVAAISGGMERETGKAIRQAYFPWICGLHILLDYYIDREEDRREGDLNFIEFYGDDSLRRERLLLFIDRAGDEGGKLPHPSFHRLVVQGLLAMYLSDQKVRGQGLDREARLLAGRGGLQTRGLLVLCRLLRGKGLL